MTKILYEDNIMSVSLPEIPATKGHIVVSPKEETNTLQDLEDEEVQHLFYGASYAATSLFELIGAHGTNIIMSEYPLRIDVISRMQEDGMNFLWTPNKANPQELDAVAKQLKDGVDIAQWKKDNPEKKQQGPLEPQELVETEEDKAEGKINYLLRSIIRKP